MTPDILSQIELPLVTGKSTSVSKTEAEFMYTFLKKIKAKTTLETGMAFGTSSCYIASATKGIHHAIDPFQKLYKNLALKNLKSLGLEKNIVFHEDYSYAVLPILLKDKLKLDFAFIDGGHRYDDIFIDFFYIDMMLKIKGYVLFHDTWLRPTQLVASWIETNKKNYKKINIPEKNMVMFQKIGVDRRKWHDFKEFYNNKSKLDHGIRKFFLNLRR